jgi:hypothetical protein
MSLETVVLSEGTETGRNILSTAIAMYERKTIGNTFLTNMRC